MNQIKIWTPTCEFRFIKRVNIYDNMLEQKILQQKNVIFSDNNYISKEEWFDIPLFIEEIPKKNCKHTVAATKFGNDPWKLDPLICGKCKVHLKIPETWEEE